MRASDTASRLLQNDCPASASECEKFASITEMLCGTLVLSADSIPEPLLRKIDRKLRSTNARFRSLFVKLRPDTPRPIYRAPRTRHRPNAPSGQPVASTGSWGRLPRGKEWLIELCGANGYLVAACANHLRALMREPDMQTLIATSPAMARLLRPYIKMLGIHRRLVPPTPGNAARVARRAVFIAARRSCWSREGDAALLQALFDHLPLPQLVPRKTAPSVRDANSRRRIALDVPTADGLNQENSSAT